MISMNSWQILLAVMVIAGVTAIGLTQEQFKLEVPNSIAAEHHELHEELRTAIASGGKTGAAAKIVEQRLKVHFEKEEEYALPQLGLLVPLAEGRVSRSEEHTSE